MNAFYSHLEKDERGNILIGKEKLIKEHIWGIDKRIKKAFQRVAFSEERLEDLISIIIKLHDLGKYTQWFQHYLKTDEKHKDDFQNHALIGAPTAYNILKDKNMFWALAAYYVIRYHHANLNDISNSYYTSSDSNWFFSRKKQIEAQHEDLKSILKIINIEMGLSLNENSLAKEIPDLFNNFENLVWEQPSIEKFFVFNYLFSLLIEGDKLDASRTEEERKFTTGLQLMKLYWKNTLPVRNKVKQVI